MKLNGLLIILSVGCLCSCEFLHFKKIKGEGGQEGAKPLARVKDIYLYPKDLEGLTPAGISKKDSADISERHVQSWVKKQLLISEAQQNLDYDEVEIERKVLDYRYALMMLEFEKTYVNRKLDTNVTQEEIEKYYKDNAENFELDQNIVRGIFVQVPKNAPKLGRLRALLQSDGRDNFDELKSYCFTYASKAHLEDSVWLYFSDVTAYTPLQDTQDEKRFLRNNKLVEVSDSTKLYFFKIEDYRLQTEASPLEFVEDDIRKIILHKRKVKLAKELENEIYDKAVKNNDFEIYKNN